MKAPTRFVAWLSGFSEAVSMTQGFGSVGGTEAIPIVEAGFKSPSIPLFQRGKFAPNSNPSLEKHVLSAVEGRGKGRFGDAVAPELSANSGTGHQAKAKFREIFL
jgi:hypothetical protein